MQSSAITAVSSLHFSFKYSTVCLLRLRSFNSRAHLFMINSFSASMEVMSFFIRLHPNSWNLTLLSIFTFCTINSEIWWNKHQYWEVYTYVQMVNVNTPAVFHHRSCQIFFFSIFWKQQYSSCSRVQHR